ncbi:Transposase [Phytophthora palmivora]|uniref:Transposase n=1 Tax=Phytophthora palmivora TaxID=4796 RepID=A0A2P4XJ98_9STRA|nr:Transposase [Phytophthora palmivora]
MTIILTLDKISMPKGTEFTPLERGKIIGLRDAGWSFAAIAKHIGRSVAGVSKFWRNKETYGMTKRSGRPRKVCDRSKRRIVLEAKKAGSSSNRVKSALGLQISSRTVRRVLQRTSHMNYVKRNRTPKLTTRHKVARRTWARTMVQLRTDWDRVVFSDEKKFNLDGPDGLQYYWHDLRCEKETYFSRQNGGGSVMVWGGFSSQGKTELAFLEGRQNSFNYQETLTNYLLPFGEAFHAGRYIFQHNNASIHASHSTKDFLKSCDVTVLDWPALSPDLNPIENVWGILAREVYRGGKQYMTPQDLKSAIQGAWENLELSRLRSLVKSMPDRASDVLEVKGKKTNH